MPTLRLLACTVVLATACTGDSPDATSLATAIVRDSAGVTIVENPALPDDAPAAWTVGSAPMLEIGVLDGAEEYQLFRVQDAHILTDGRIAVVNSGSQEVRIYDADGVYTDTWGGRGEGPGEFMAPTTLSLWPGDSVAVWDLRLRRLSVFTSDGVLGRTLTFPANEDMSQPSFRHVLPNGTVVASMSVSLAAEELATGMTRTPVAVAVVDAEGTLLAPLGEHPGREGFIRIGENQIAIFRLPFYRDLIIEAAGSSSIISPTDRFELKFWADSGALTRIVRVAQPVRLLTDADREAELERRVAAAPEEARPGVRSGFQDIPMPDTLPAFSGVVADNSEHVWVQLFRLAADEGPTQWIVLDPEGQALGRMEFPEGFTVFEIGEDYVLGSAKDDLDVEVVQLWPLKRQ